MGRYEPVAVDRPPARKPKEPKERVGPLQAAVIECAEKQEPGVWYLLATYKSRTGAFQAANRLNERDWPWPIAIVGRSHDDRRSGLYVKRLIPKKG